VSILLRKSNGFVNSGVLEIPYNGVDDDCDETTLDDDLDGDGFNLADDCDDNNALINSAAVEIIYNGLDDDCNAATLDNDLDQDGFNLADDCDDNNAAINTAAEEIPNNGIDEDCDGSDLIIISTKDISAIQPQIFPNPTTDKITIILPVNTEVEFTLRESTGKAIRIGHFEKETELDLSALPQGIYFLSLRTDESLWVKRVVKQ
jgi:Secretion system C-terminal sorting domain/Putative metal-binding motif